MQTEEESRLFIAVKEWDLHQANRLITEGVKVNSFDNLGNLAVDYAWTNKFYDAVLLLLKSDSKFPKQFDLDQLNENDRSAQDLVSLVKERNFLHMCIEEDNLEQVQELISKTKYKSHFFFNEQNESALYTAIKRRKIKIYAYLRSIGAEFSSEDERKELDQLDLKDKVALKDAMVFHFPGVSGGPIHYLISKSRSQKPVEGFEDKLKDFYSKLDQIREISSIFRVIQHADSLDIVFDFDEESVTRINPTVSENTKGETNSKEGRLYIAAGPKRGERKILGTIAHELTHMAMQILFENDCKPYVSTDKENENEFEKITRKMLDIVKVFEGDPSQIVLNVNKGYHKEDHHCELIVTVPQILAEHEDGQEWLEGNARELLDFYIKKIVPKCHEFDEKSVTRKIQKEVRNLNETLGEIIKLKKFNATFRNLRHINNFLNDQDMKIFILRTKNTFLGMMKILQSIYGESYIDSYDKYLLAELSSTSPIKEMVLTFYLNTCDTLILKCVDDSFIKVLIDEFWDTARDILESNPNKRLIFLVHPNVEESFFRTLRTQRMKDICADTKDENTSLNELSDKSRSEILSKRVIFQGGEIVLSKLTSADENIFKLVTGDAIESLIQGNRVHIGEKTFDHYNLNSFSYVDEEVKLRTFVREFKNWKDVFVIQGVHEKDKLMEYFKDLIQSKLITKQKLADQIYILDTKCFEIGSRRLILTDENFSEEDFQSLCRHNWDKKIYLIEVENLKFVLKQLYNPNFYLERKFKIIISQEKLWDLIRKLPNEMFVVGTSLRHHGVELYNENVKFVKAEVSETIFNKYVKNKVTVHWFLVPDWKLIYWKNSYGSSSSLWLDFNNLETNDDCLLEETNLVTHFDKIKVMILSDNPGMGKSTTLTKLYESPTIAQTHWVIRIDLKTHLETIKKVEANNMSVKTVIDFLKRTKSNFDNKLTQDLLESALRPEGTFMTKVLLAFDGFDELLDDKARNTVIAMLKYLRDNTRCKIWITTRLHYKKTLEDVLGTFAFQFEPIDDENKKIYVTRYLQERLKITFEPELAEDVFDPNKYSKVQFYVEGFLKIINHVFTKNVATFIGTPLQLYLMTENCVQHFKNWIDGNDNMVYFSHLGNNILSVFENFILGKYEIYFKKQKIFEEYMKEDAKEKADEYHKALAESLTKNKSLSKKHEKKNSMMLLIGLIQSVDQKNLEFIHFTFREYFAALIFQDCVSDEPPDFKYLVFLLENKEFRVVRNFVNLLLGNFSVKGLPDENLEAFKEILDVSGPELSATMKNIFCNIVKENNGNILDFVFLICGEDFSLISDLLTLNSGDLMLLHVAIYNGNKQITEALFRTMEKLSTENQKEILKASSNHGTILEVAVRFGHCLPVVKIVFEKLELVLEPNELILFLQEVFVDDRGIYPQTQLRYKQSLFHYLAETGNIEMTLFLLEKVQELLPEQQKEILTMSNTGGQDILYVALRNGHVELAKIILAKLDGVLSPLEQIDLFSWPCTQYPIVSDKMECTVHVSATLGNLEVMEILYEKYKAANWLKKFVTMKNSSLKTVSHIATQKGHTKLVKMLVEKMDEILFSTEEQAEAEGIDQEVVRKEKDEIEEEEPKRNDQETEEKNEEAEVKDEDAEGKEEKWIEFIAMEVKYGNTVLHLAARNGNIEVMDIWLKKWEILPLKKRKEIITLQNEYGQSILHVIVQKGHTELMEMILPRLNASLLFETEEVIMMTDNDSQTILHLAVAHGNTEMVKILLDKGLNSLSPKGRLDFVLMTDGDGDTALHLAAGNGNFEVMLMLLDISKQLLVEKEFFLMENSFSETVFHVASQSGHAQLLRMLLKKAEQLLSPEEQEILTKKLKGLNTDHETVLHLSAKSGSFEVLTIWLERLSREEQKEMILMKNNRCHNILYTAAEKDHNEFIKALLEKINGILSAEEQKQFLLAMSNKSKYSEEKKETVLHLAARLNKIELMKMLLEKSEKLSILKELIERRNSSSKTAFDIVSRRYYKEMERMLQEKMDQVQSSERRD